jgi:hypothetical protein
MATEAISELLGLAGFSCAAQRCAWGEPRWPRADSRGGHLRQVRFGAQKKRPALNTDRWNQLVLSGGSMPSHTVIRPQIFTYRLSLQSYELG